MESCEWLRKAAAGLPHFTWPNTNRTANESISLILPKPCHRRGRSPSEGRRGKHDPRDHTKNHKDVDVGQGRGLRLHTLVNRCHRPRVSFMRANARVSQMLGKAIC